MRGHYRPAPEVRRVAPARSSIVALVQRHGYFGAVGGRYVADWNAYANARISGGAMNGHVKIRYRRPADSDFHAGFSMCRIVIFNRE